MIWHTDLPIRAAADATPHALAAAGAALLERADPLVPVDTSRLRRSGAVVLDDDSAYVVYDTPYAVPVHERLEVFHPHGQAKFLEEPLGQFGADFLAILARELDRALR